MEGLALRSYLACWHPTTLHAVPNFWLRALKALDAAVDCLHRRDDRALHFLVDVRFVFCACVGIVLTLDRNGTVG